MAAGSGTAGVPSIVMFPTTVLVPTSISKVPLFENLFLRLDAVCFRHGQSWMAALRNR